MQAARGDIQQEFLLRVSRGASPLAVANTAMSRSFRANPVNTLHLGHPQPQPCHCWASRHPAFLMWPLSLFLWGLYMGQCLGGCWYAVSMHVLESAMVSRITSGCVWHPLHCRSQGASVVLRTICATALFRRCSRLHAGVAWQHTCTTASTSCFSGLYMSAAAASNAAGSMGWGLVDRRVSSTGCMSHPQ